MHAAPFPFQSAQSVPISAGAVDPVTAFGPPGGNGELNVSVVVAPVPRGFSLRSFGDAESIGGRLLANVIAPAGSGREAMLLSASEKELDGVLYIRLEYTVQGASFSRHNVSVCAVKRGKLFSLNAQSPADLWPENLEFFSVVADSFKVLSDSL
ncbi:unnamed protein product [Closterium sp. Yama58-4]|nr:unnamed protein product [Closterium sp. Yama58-4]